MSVYSPYSVSPSVNAGRNMCDARSLTCVQNGGLSRNSFVIPRGREDPREDDDQHQPEPLRGHRVEGERGADRQALGLRPSPPGGDDPGEDAEHDREDGAERDHRQGVDQGDAEVRRDGLLVLVRDAEVSMGQLLQVDDVLLPLRLVEPELHLERVPQLLRRVRDAREVRDRGAGREPEEDEVDRHRHPDGDDRERDALQDIVGPPHEEPPTSGALASGSGCSAR